MALFTKHPRERQEDWKEKSQGMGAIDESIQLECTSLQWQRAITLAEDHFILCHFKKHFLPLPYFGYARTTLSLHLPLNSWSFLRCKLGFISSHFRHILLRLISSGKCRGTAHLVFRPVTQIHFWDMLSLLAPPNTRSDHICCDCHHYPNPTTSIPKEHSQLYISYWLSKNSNQFPGTRFGRDKNQNTDFTFKHCFFTTMKNNFWFSRVINSWGKNNSVNTNEILIQ